MSRRLNATKHPEALRGVDDRNPRPPLLPSHQTMKMMAKAAFAACEEAVDRPEDVLQSVWLTPSSSLSWPSRLGVHRCANCPRRSVAGSKPEKNDLGYLLESGRRAEMSLHFGCQLHIIE